jgi:hypothetical protein
MPTARQIRPGSQRSSGGMAHQAQTELTVIITQATCLARSGMARRWRQSRTMGPKRGCASIQASARAAAREAERRQQHKGRGGQQRQEDADDAAASASAPAVPHSTRCQCGRELGSGGSGQHGADGSGLIASA